MWQQLGALILLQFEGNGFKLTTLRTAGKVCQARKFATEAWLGSLTRKCSNWCAKMENKQTGSGYSPAVNMEILGELQNITKNRAEGSEDCFFQSGAEKGPSQSMAKSHVNHKNRFESVQVRLICRHQFRSTA